MTVLLAWATGVLTSAIYGLLLTVCPSVSRVVTIAYAAIAFAAWVYLAVHYERSHRR